MASADMCTIADRRLRSVPRSCKTSGRRTVDHECHAGHDRQRGAVHRLGVDQAVDRQDDDGDGDQRECNGIEQGGEDGGPVVAERPGIVPRPGGPPERRAARRPARRRRSGCDRRRRAGPTQCAANPATSSPATSATLMARPAAGGSTGRRRAPGHRVADHRVAGRSPRSTCAATSCLDERQVVGVGDPDAPAVGGEHQEPLAARCGVRDQLTDQVGQEHLVLSGRSVMAASNSLAHLRPEPPQVHRDERSPGRAPRVRDRRRSQRCRRRRGTTPRRSSIWTR